MSSDKDNSDYDPYEHYSSKIKTYGLMVNPNGRIGAVRSGGAPEMWAKGEAPEMFASEEESSFFLPDDSGGLSDLEFLVTYLEWLCSFLEGIRSRSLQKPLIYCLKKLSSGQEVAVFAAVSRSNDLTIKLEAMCSCLESVCVDLNAAVACLKTNISNLKSLSVRGVEGGFRIDGVFIKQKSRAAALDDWVADMKRVCALIQTISSTLGSAAVAFPEVCSLIEDLEGYAIPLSKAEEALVSQALTSLHFKLNELSNFLESVSFGVNSAASSFEKQVAALPGPSGGWTGWPF